MSILKKKKDDSHSLIIPKIFSPKEVTKGPSLMKRFGIQRFKRSETLLKSAEQHFHTTVPLI